MSIKITLNTITASLLASMPQVERGAEFVNAYIALKTLAEKNEWDAADISLLNFISKRIDISKKLFSTFDETGRKLDNCLVTDKPSLELLVLVLFRGVVFSKEQGHSLAVILKRLNVLSKAMAIVDVAWLDPKESLGAYLKRAWEAAGLSTQETTIEHDVIKVSEFSDAGSTKEFKEIPLTVLFYEGPIARAYLEVIASLGFKPQKIINLVSANDLVTRKVVGKWLPKSLRTSYAYNIQKRKIHHWANHLLKNNSPILNAVKASISKSFSFSQASQERAHQLLELSSYSDKVEDLPVTGLSDQSLYQYLTEEQTETILFTGGGIVPEKLLSIDGLNFLHIHPGYLPDIRGADCVLWSNLTEGYFSASCFFMAPGIDVGDIIQPNWLPQLALRHCGANTLDSVMQYRLVYAFIDPWVRAVVLRDVLGKCGDKVQFETNPQSEDEGLTFHFMNDKLKQLALGKLFS